MCIVFKNGRQCPRQGIPYCKKHKKTEPKFNDICILNEEEEAEGWFGSTPDMQTSPPPLTTFNGMVECLKDEYRKENKALHDEKIRRTKENLENACKQLDHYEASGHGGMQPIMTKYLDRWVKGWRSNAHIHPVNLPYKDYSKKPNLMLTDVNFYNQMMYAITTLTIREELAREELEKLKASMGKPERLFKAEYVEACENIAKLKVKLKQTNIELDKLRKVKKERKHIKKLEQQLFDAEVRLVAEQADNLDAPPPAYSAT